MFTNEDIEKNRVGVSEVRCKVNLSRITFLAIRKGLRFSKQLYNCGMFFYHILNSILNK